jgi:hypothetical protein
MSGSASERIAVVTARGRSVPDLMHSTVPGMLPKITCTCPPSISASAWRVSAMWAAAWQARVSWRVDMGATGFWPGNSQP